MPQKHLKPIECCLDALVQPCVRVPYAWVDQATDEYMTRTSRLTVAKKYLHRRLALGAQSRREIGRIAPDQRVLYLYGGKHSIGDVVMELSGRALLRGRPGPVDLLTTSSLKPMFEGDDIFRHVYDDADEIDPGDYDVVFMSEFNYPTIRLKKRRFRKLPFACMFRYFNGPESNRTQFSWARINDVFGLGRSPESLSANAKPYLRQEPELPSALAAEVAPLRPFLAVAIGGVYPRRTYDHWMACLQAYDEAHASGLPGGVVLLGSDNGAATAQALMANGRFRNLRLLSLVGELSLRDSKRVIANSALFVGADGGLMHVAHTTPTPSVTLFAATEPPHLRLTPSCRSTPLHTDGGVSAIDPKDLAQTIVDSLGRR
jgi:hypothetical protein